jgi:CheY-like chemotaxis protein
MEAPAVLVIDDDPTHLRIYGWIVQAAGYRAVPRLVMPDSLSLPDEPIDLVVLDYHLHGQLTAVDVAHLAASKFPGAPILVLSDSLMMPEDIAPLVSGFVRKGDPAKFVDTLAKTLDKTLDPKR